MQRRDVGNEVIVALAAIGMLALALTFGVVLTLSRTVSNPTATGTAVAQGGTEAATLPGTAAAVTKVTATTPPTHTTTPTAALNVALATGTATSSSTGTSAATITTRTPTATLTSTATNTSTATVTATFTPSDTPTDTPTATAVPTDTPTFTDTPLPTNTPTDTPTDIPTDTPTPSDTPTDTPTTTVTATYLPTFPFPAAPTAKVPLTACAQRAGWVTYIVQQGDTLFGISRQAGIGLTELQQANCISNPNSIYAGEIIVVPPGTSIGGNMPTGTIVSINSGNSDVCPNPNARITSPISRSTVSGIVTLYGSTTIPYFDYYIIEYKPDINPDWVSFGKNFAVVNNGILGKFDPNPSQLPSGGYSLRLRVFDSTFASPAPCTIHITLKR